MFSLSRVIQRISHKLPHHIRRYLFIPTLVFKKPKMPFDAVFVVGQSKTGTTSMHHFLKRLGCKHMTINKFAQKLYHSKKWWALDIIVSRYNSFDDSPWHRLDLIEHYMKSGKDFRFILTTRNPDAWFNSFVAYFGHKGRDVPREQERRELIEKLLLRHNERCLELSEKYHKPILIIDLSRPGVEKEITTFLGLPDTAEKMPKANQGFRT